MKHSSLKVLRKNDALHLWKQLVFRHLSAQFNINFASCTPGIQVMVSVQIWRLPPAGIMISRNVCVEWNLICWASRPRFSWPLLLNTKLLKLGKDMYFFISYLLVFWKGTIWPSESMPDHRSVPLLSFNHLCLTFSNAYQIHSTLPVATYTWHNLQSPANLPIRMWEEIYAFREEANELITLF